VPLPDVVQEAEAKAEVDGESSTKKRKRKAPSATGSAAARKRAKEIRLAVLARLDIAVELYLQSSFPPPHVLQQAGIKPLSE
jgi:hypothetical protein